MPKKLAEKPGTLRSSRTKRNSAIGKLHQAAEFGLSRSENQGIDAARHHLIDFAAFQLRALLRRRNDQTVALGAEPGGDSFGDLSKKWVNEVRDDEPNEAGSARGESPRSKVRLVVNFLHAAQNAFPRFRTDIR